MKNIALKLRYDGTRYHGWQVQKNNVTVAETVEDALGKLLGERVRVTGCGRTDAGVHALRYCANFHADCTIPMERMPLALNSRLPGDISCLEAVEAGEDFNAILSCKMKEYTYRIYNARIPDPFERDRSYFYPAVLDVETMKRAAAQFVGTHDFAAVRSVGTETKTTVRTVYWCDVESAGPVVTMRVCADGFLYNMVRAIMGTVLYCSEGKLDYRELPRLLKTRDRRLTGPTAPPQGLYLSRVWYDGPVGEMMAR